MLRHEVARTFQRSSTLAPYAICPPTMDAETPAEVLLLEAFFHRVSARPVYASWRPTLWMSRPAVEMSPSLCCADASASNAIWASFLSLENWPETFAGMEERNTKPLSTEKPSIPAS